ncbi:non-ribosomal peptide synthetase [Streptomyces sp. NRRL S-646]|uniref:non-ribosomal peptide synthetase n=1 Tax=Streptomyces sp. NRRL S-646 TaxID=1463917 RepID=UPI00068C9D3C|nr:non-ribosomal peptide synthetase [Streptomyces sp. NRRL S-646]
MGNLTNATVPHALTGPELPLPKLPLPELLDGVAAARPDATALVAPDATCTFGELLGRVRRLARLLLDRGIAAEDIVAVLLPRTSDSIVALLAVLTAGATHLPVDGGYPHRRITAMLTDARPDLLITTSALAVPPGCDAPVLLLDDPEVAAALAASSPAPLGPADRARPIAPHDAAYVLFTSGSTGRPKGIVVEHRSLANLFASHRELFFGPATAHLGRTRLRVAHTAAQSFDASWDPVLWLFEGHELHLVDDRTRRDPSLLVEYLVEQRVDVVETTPTFAEQLDHNGLFDPSHPHRPGVLALGGEDVGPAQWQRLRTLPRLLALNLYGPSECTVDAFLARLSAHPEPAIGLPVANTRAYVLDERRRPSPPGETGELHLAGPGVARGYLNRPDLTAERFLADPWWPQGGTMYRTGDLVRRAPDGTLVFVGRADGQVKLRGQRLELGEIEAVLLRHDSVAQVVAVLHEEAPGVRHLVSYVVPARGRRCVPGELLAHAAGELAAYMVPSAVVPVDVLPLTPNGKLDRAALPRPVFGGATTGPGPGTPTERLLCRLFSEALGGTDIGPRDDFFERGGDSMAAIRVVSAARERGLTLRLQDVFEHRRADDLAEAVDGCRADDGNLLAKIHHEDQGRKTPFHNPPPKPGR